MIFEEFSDPNDGIIFYDSKNSRGIPDVRFLLDRRTKRGDGQGKSSPGMRIGMEKRPPKTSFHGHFGPGKFIGSRWQIQRDGARNFRRNGGLGKGRIPWGVLDGILGKGRKRGKQSGWKGNFVLQGEPGDVGEPGQKVSAGISSKGF